MLAYVPIFAALLLAVAFCAAGVLMMRWARRQIVEFRRELAGLALVLVGVGLLFFGVFWLIWGPEAFLKYFGVPAPTPIPDTALNITGLVGWLILAVANGRSAFKGSSLRQPRVSNYVNLAIVAMCFLLALMNAYELL